MRPLTLAVCFALATLAFAQAPSIHPRGVLNEVTIEPAPSRVAPGGRLVIQGINLGPIDGWKASGTPLPTQFGDPPTEVLIGGRPAPLVSATPGKIVAQVPWETPQGLMNVVVRRGEVRSRPATVRVAAVVPAVRTRNQQGFGEVDAVQDGSMLRLSASGLGITEPRVPAGEAAPADPPVLPRAPVRAYVGGLAAGLTVQLSPERVGEFEVTLAIPEGAQPGDVVHLEAANQAPANRALFGSLSAPQVRFVPLPEGAAAARQFRASDLRGDYIVATAPRGPDGCFPAWLFDLGRTRASRLDPCLIAAQPNAASPVMTINEGAALTSLVGPASGEPQTGLTNRVALFQPALAEALIVELPSAVTNLTPGVNGNPIAIAPGEAPVRYMIDALTGSVAEVEANNPAPVDGAGGQAGGRVIDPNVDLGDGIRHSLSTLLGAGPGLLSVLVGDDPDKPSIVKLAVLDSRTGEVVLTRDFAAGWLPLFPPQPPAPAPRPGAPAPPVQAPQPRPRAVAIFDAPTRTLYVLASKTDSSAQAFVAFTGEAFEASVVEFPEGWYAAACSPGLPLFALELSRRIAFLGSLAPELEIRTPCLASGYLFLDPATKRLSAAPLPGQGQITVGAALGDVNDYLYGTNADPGNRNLADTLYVLDSVAGLAFRLDIPNSVTSFTALQSLSQLSALQALAINRVAGDAGILWFDLEREETTLFPVPEGFATVQPVAVFPNTRKLVARGIAQTGSQFLIYDLINGDLDIVANPEGVAWVGNAPAQQAGGGGGAPQPQPQPPPGGQNPQAAIQLLMPSTKSNWVAAMGFAADRQAVGLVAVRIP